MDNIFKLSVIVCVFNEENCILRALKSLRANKIYLTTEIIVIDDCSTNMNTLKLLARLKEFTNIKLIRSETNLGLSNSRNLGFENASTNYICPLDADDELPPNTLDLVYNCFKENSDIDFIFGNYFLKNAETNHITEIDFNSILDSNNKIDIKKLIMNWRLLGTSPCTKRIWGTVGGYSMKYSYSVQDVDFWIRVLKTGASGYYLNDFIYNWNRSDYGMNNTYDHKFLMELLEVHKDFYLKALSDSEIANTLFGFYYPNKSKIDLDRIAKQYFPKLSLINMIRFIYFTSKSIKFR